MNSGFKKITIAVFLAVLSCSIFVVLWFVWREKNSVTMISPKMEQQSIQSGAKQQPTVINKPVQTSSSVAVPTGWKTYHAKKYGFKISFPPTWKSLKGDFGYNEEVNPDFGYVSFQPDGTKYGIIQVGIYTNEQWNKWQHKQDEFILGKNQDYVFTSSLDPNIKASDDGCDGGGQFNKFEQDRCKESPQIIETFHISVP